MSFVDVASLGSLYFASKAMAALARHTLKSLKTLQLDDNTPLGDAVMLALRRCSSLTEVHCSLTNTRLTWWLPELIKRNVATLRQFRVPKLSAKIVQALVLCPQLERLSLDLDERLSAAVAKRIKAKNMPKLQRLAVFGDTCTHHDLVRILKQRMRFCSVFLHSNFVLLGLLQLSDSLT